MHKWMARAAGGTSQREKPGPAMVRSLSKKPGLAPGKSKVAVLSIKSPLGCGFVAALFVFFVLFVLFAR
ncbi:hypothetical protein D3C86_1114900 [compost metagenome]